MNRFLMCAGLLIAATFSLSAAEIHLHSAGDRHGNNGGKTVTISYNSPRVKGHEGHVFTSDSLIKTAHGSQYPFGAPARMPQRH